MKALYLLFLIPLFVGPPAEAATFVSWILGTQKKVDSRPVPKEQVYRSSNTPRGRYGVGSTGCRIRSKGCGNAHIQVDVASNCMCVGKSCFKVASGYKTGDIGTKRYKRRNGKLVQVAITKRDVVNAQTHNTSSRNKGRFGKVGDTYDRRRKNGCGKRRDAGCRYETLSNTPKSFNYDAMKMSPRNTAGGGKWIHQIPGCGDYTYRTQGCIGVPCDKWPLVKAQMGKPMSICGGGAQGYTGPSLKGSRRNSGGQTPLQRRVSAATARQKAGRRGSERSVN